MRRIKYLADVNVLIALMDEDHVHHQLVVKWFDSSKDDEFGVCAFTETGFLRVATNPKSGSHSIESALESLASFDNHAGYRFWPMTEGWADLVEPFRERVFGHQQITDAYLLGFALREGAVLVTLDKAVRYMAGGKYAGNVVVLE